MKNYTKIILKIVFSVGFLLIVSCNNDKNNLIRSIPENLSNIEDSHVKTFVSELKSNDFEICNNLNCITSDSKNLLFDWVINAYKPIVLIGRTNFDHIFTLDDDLWDSGCSPRDKKPFILIGYIIETENNIGITYTSGGLARMNKFAIINKEKAKDVYALNRNSEKLTGLITDVIESTVNSRYEQ